MAHPLAVAEPAEAPAERDRPVVALEAEDAAWTGGILRRRRWRDPEELVHGPSDALDVSDAGRIWLPSSTMSFAPGNRVASSTALPTGIQVMPPRCMTSVGTCTCGSSAVASNARAAARRRCASEGVRHARMKSA